MNIDSVLNGLEEDFGRLLARQIISVRLLRLELEASRARVQELEKLVSETSHAITLDYRDVMKGANVGG